MVAQPVIESLQAELREISAEAKEAEKVLIALERSARLQAQVAPQGAFQRIHAPHATRDQQGKPFSGTKAKRNTISGMDFPDRQIRDRRIRGAVGFGKSGISEAWTDSVPGILWRPLFRCHSRGRAPWLAESLWRDECPAGSLMPADTPGSGGKHICKFDARTKTPSLIR